MFFLCANVFLPSLILPKKLNQKMEDMNNAKNFESKNISLSLRSSQCQEGNYSLLLLIIRRVYALVRELNTSLITGSRLDCVSFSTVGIAVGEEKSSLRTAGRQVEVRYKIL